MKGVLRLFADMTGVVEDLHGIAIDGQRHDNSADMSRALAAHAMACVASMAAIAVVIEMRLAESRR